MSIDLTDFLDTPVIQRPARQWSPKQQAIFEYIKDGTGHLLVQAVAGSGKTTTECEGMYYVPSNKRILAVAFNKAIQMTLSQRVPQNVEARTFHSIGAGVLKANSHKYDLQNYKTMSILRNNFEPQIVEEYGYALKRIVSHAKSLLLGCEGPLELLQFQDLVMSSDASLTEVSPDLLARAAMRLFELCIKERRIIDFDDMLYFPFYFGYTFPMYDFIFVDEAQDLAYIQHQMIFKMLNPDGRVIAVGDRAQAIYAFRGADSFSMDNIKTTFGCKELPLDITYRCAISITNEARNLVSYIECAPEAENGEVRRLDTFPDISSFTPSDLIVCRNNAPLFKIALAFIQAKLPLVLSSNYDKTLQSFMKKLEEKCPTDNNLEEFRMALKNWHFEEMEQAEKLERYHYMDAIQDKYEAVLALCDDENTHTIDDMYDLLYSLFRQGNGPLVSTIHKSKGLEADRVFFYAPNLLPSPYAQTNEALQQENNLFYVAVTRAKKGLYYINSNTPIRG